MSNWKKIVVSGSQAHLSSVTASNGSIISGSLTMSGSITNVNNLDFNMASPVASAAGRFVWDDGNGSLDLGLKGGNVNLLLGQQTYARIFNAEATTLNKGEVVYISGSQGNRVSAKRADYSGEGDSATTIGFVAESIASGAEGFIITNGVLEKLNTVGLTQGKLLYLSSSGQYSETKPIAPQHTVTLGYVERVHATAGSIYVKIDNGYELDELHNVLTTGVSNGDLLMYSASLWKNSKQLTGSYGLTGSLQATSFTGSLQGSASYAIQSLSSSYATTASYVLGGGGGGVTIGGPTSTDWSQYGGTPNRYMLVSDGVTNNITASHLIQLDTSNESINIYAGIEGFNDASIFLSQNAYVSAGNFIGTASYATLSATASSVQTLRQNVTVSGSMFFSGSLNNPVFVDYEEKYTTISPSANSLSLNLSNGNVFLVNLNNNVDSITISNQPSNTNIGSFTLILNQIGVYFVTWPTSVTWSGGPPELAGDCIDFYSFLTYNGGTNWYGFIGGQNYPN